MKKILFFTALLSAPLLAANLVLAQKKNQLEGVWRVVEVIVPGQNSGKDTTISTPQPGIVIFTKNYYSIVVIQSAQPRTAADQPKDAQNLTDAEKIARFTEWSPLVANSGTYEIKGSTILRHPIVAKSVAVMNNQNPLADDFTLEGTSTLRITPAADRAGIRPKVKLTRLE
ncbi:MAG TPA: lipocalin-like domain-containing protein [Chitinophagaceae bacterium]|nr:lipocalin-like domain-containing protein [Chitinophagaceae bacterium]